MRRRRADARDPRRRGPDPLASPAARGPGGERGRPHAAPAAARASARSDRCGVRRGFHERQARDIRVPRLPLADSSSDVPAHQSPNIHVRGYKEEGTTTTPFDMVMLNDLDRYHLVIDVIDRVPSLGSTAAHVRQEMVDRRLRSRQYTRDHGQDPPDITTWVWPN